MKREGSLFPRYVRPRNYWENDRCRPIRILREVYRIKDELNREIGGDVEKLFDRLRKFAKKHPERMVNREQVRELSGRKRASAKR